MVKKICRQQFIKKETCYIKFFKKIPMIDHSVDLGWNTIRGEQIIFDCDKDENIIGIELIGPNKKCQEVCSNGK